MAVEAELLHVQTKLTDGSELPTPWWRIDSGRDGPTLLIIAAQHGNEVQGIEVLRRFMPVCAEGLVAGTMMLAPYGNLLAIRHRRNSIMLGPEEKYTETHKSFNMNSLWPGNPEGNDIERVVYDLDRELVSECTHVVDLHCWNRFWATATLAWDDGDSRRLGEAAGTRFTWWRGRPETPDDHTQIRNIVINRGGGAMAMEFSGQYCVYEREVQTGLRAMTNVATALGMLEGEPEIPPHSGIKVTDENTTSIEAPCRGLFVEAPGLQLEDRIETGQRLGHIIRDDNLEVEEIVAPVSGWLWRFGSHRPDPDVSLADQHPYSDPGDPLASIVSD